ncbi:MAG: glycosyltransferase [Pseudomonas sp.]|nr:MAG: glycosyltransferase [Pseudomonas sp.]
MEQHTSDYFVEQTPPAAKELRVFVHLAENKDAKRWLEAWRNGTLVGFNDETPYSYGRASSFGCCVQFSESSTETTLQKWARFLLRGLLGFDFLHAWRQREKLKHADVIWTHTESQYLAVAAVKVLAGGRAKIIGQSVWLFDKWGSLSFLRKLLYRALIRQIDVLTFLSELNLAAAGKAFPSAQLRLVPFGIPDEVVISPIVRDHEQIKILSLGNDRHRDWLTLIDAVSNHPKISVKILSNTLPRRHIANSKNIELFSAKTNEELKRAFAWATVVCVPLKNNLHASGITAIQEAVLSGVPVVATNTGGLQLYFSGDEIRYVAAKDPKALLTALIEIGTASVDACNMARKAQARLAHPPYIGASDYVRRHVEISRELVL